MGHGNALFFDLDQIMCSREESTAIADFNGLSFTAQRAVFSHDKFCNVTISIIQAIQSDVVGRNRVYFAACQDGTFSDVVLRSVEQVLNVLECEQTDANDRPIRAVDCNHWALTDHDIVSEAEDILTTIAHWFGLPYPSQLPPIDTDRRQFYGWEAYNTVMPAAAFDGNADDQYWYDITSNLCRRKWGMVLDVLHHRPTWGALAALGDGRSIITAFLCRLPNFPLLQGVTFSAWRVTLPAKPLGIEYPVDDDDADAVRMTAVAFPGDQDDGHPAPENFFNRYPRITMDCDDDGGVLFVFDGGLPAGGFPHAPRIVHGASASSGYRGPPPQPLAIADRGTPPQPLEITPPVLLPDVRLPPPAVIRASPSIPVPSPRVILASTSISETPPPIIYAKAICCPVTTAAPPIIYPKAIGSPVITAAPSTSRPSPKGPPPGEQGRPSDASVTIITRPSSITPPDAGPPATRLLPMAPPVAASETFAPRPQPYGPDNVPPPPPFVPRRGGPPYGPDDVPPPPPPPPVGQDNAPKAPPIAHGQQRDRPYPAAHNMPNVGRNNVPRQAVHMRAWNQRAPCQCTDRRNPNIDHWVVVLRDDVGLDGRAINDLKNLADSGRAGYMHANSIIGKCFKKTNDQYTAFPKPSNFVVNCCKKAAEKIARDGS